MVFTRFHLESWLACVTALGVAEQYRAEAIATFHRLNQVYRQPWRAYHTPQHIEACLVWCAKWRSEWHNWAAVEVAIWFHDAVYLPHRTDNETRSAQWAAAVLQRWQVEEAVRSWVVSAVLATQHGTTQHQNQTPETADRHQLRDTPLDHDLARMLDLDLSILAASPREFSQYEAAIRREYASVSDSAFRVGRLAVLRSLWERDRLFQSPIGIACFEVRARQNLMNAIARLTV